MIITSSLIFYLLSKKYQLSVVPDKPDNIPVTTIRALRSLSLDKQDIPTGFYITDDTNSIKNITTEHCVFLLLYDPVYVELPDNSSAAFIQTADSIDQIIYETSEIIRKLQEWDLDLKDASFNKANLSHLLQVAHRVFPYPLAIVDRNYEITGQTPDAYDNYTLSEFTQISPNKLKAKFSVISDLVLDPAFVDSLKKEDAFIYSQNDGRTLLCMNIFENNQYLARIITTMASDFTPGIMHLFRHICEPIKNVFLKYTDDILVKRQNDRIHTLLYDLLFTSQTSHLKDISAILSDYGWEKSHRYTVTILQFSDIEEFNHIYYYLCNQLEMQWKESYAIKTEKEIVWIVNNELCKDFSKTDTIHQALSLILRDLVCKAGMSDEASDIEKINILYEHAVFALENGSIIKDQFWYFHFDDYTLDYLLSKVGGLIMKEDIHHEGIEKLIDYDSRKATNLTSVLTAFIENNFNASTASDELFMHRSTFNRQMQKIEAITDINWHKFDNINNVIHALITLKLYHKL